VKNLLATQSEKETTAFGRKFAGELKGAVVFGLTGDLGTGKTKFVKGLAKGLGVKENITSPTFVLMRTYRLKGKIENFVHIDCYRISSSDELLNFGLKEYIEEGKSIIAIEWAEKIKDILCIDTVWINFWHGGRENERRLEFKNLTIFKK